MDQPILFSSENRLLSSATSDFGMYGGQTDAQFSVHEAERDESVAATTGNMSASSAFGPTDLSTSTAPHSDGGPVGLVHADTGAGTLAPQSFLIAPSAADYAPMQQVAFGEAAMPVQSDWHPAALGAGAPTPALDLAHTPASTEAAPLPLSDGPLMGSAADLLDNLATGPSAGLVSPIAGVADGLLTSTTGIVDDTLEGLAGSDPLGGVATLVNLVSVSDTFDLTPIVAPLLDTDGDPGSDILDTLAGEESLTDSLLGNHHDEGGLLGGHDVDHPLGL